MNDPGEVLDEAVSLMRRGEYEASLQKHLWFHDHALEHEPALAGVRLSFALAYWAELGEKYPPAMQALRGVRDTKAEAITGGKGSFELFHDVAAINRQLDEPAKTVALFKSLHQTHPDLAGRCYHVAEPDLVAGGEYGLCACYVPDPPGRFEEIRQLRQVHLELAGENPAFDSPKFRNYAEQHFADEVRRLVQVLAGAGRRPDAERVRDLALAVSASPEVRAALDEALLPPGA